MAAMQLGGPSQEMHAEWPAEDLGMVPREPALKSQMAHKAHQGSQGWSGEGEKELGAIDVLNPREEKIYGKRSGQRN